MRCGATRVKRGETFTSCQAREEVQSFITRCGKNPSDMKGRKRYVSLVKAGLSIVPS